MVTAAMKLKGAYTLEVELRLTSTAYKKALTVWITGNWKILKNWEYQTTWPASWETSIQVRKQQLDLDMEQETGSK